jgi:hypothetical protein
VESLDLALIAIALLIPVTGFIMMISHARKASSRTEQRWRKSHGLLFWVLIPGVAGLLTVMGMIRILPRTFSMLGIGLLGLSTLLSWNIQKKREERDGLL